MKQPHHRRAIAFEPQGRFATEEPWITLAIATTPAAAEHNTRCRRDPWGRAPTQTRIIPIHPRHRP